MLEGINLYSIDYYKKTVFTGSYRGLCFRVGKVSSEETGEGSFDADGAGGIAGGAEDVLRVQAWKGPYILEKTKETVHTEYFEYSDEGLASVYDWIEEKQKEL